MLLRLKSWVFSPNSDKHQVAEAHRPEPMCGDEFGAKLCDL